MEQLVGISNATVKIRNHVGRIWNHKGRIRNPPVAYSSFAFI